MDVDAVTRLVRAHLESEFARLGSKNRLEVALVHDGRWWLANPRHWNYAAASKAVEHVWGVKPDMTREGGR
jgi:Cys-Gly metallodipeptidase DUG1